MNSYYLIRCGVLESIFLSLFHLNRQRRRFKGKNIFLITFPWLLCPSPGFFWKKSQDVILYPLTPKICSLVNGVYQVESFWYHHWCRFIAILEFLLCIGNYDWDMQCGVMLGEKKYFASPWKTFYMSIDLCVCLDVYSLKKDICKPY